MAEEDTDTGQGGAAAAAGTEAQATEAGAEAREKSWLDDLGPDMREWVDKKGFKEPSALLESYRNLEKLKGAGPDKLVKLPDDPAEDGAMDEVWKRLGRPESAEKYTNAIGDEHFDETFRDFAAEAHRLGLTDDQFAGLQKKFAETTGQALQARQAQYDEAYDEWAAQNPRDLANVQRMMAAAGATEDEVGEAMSGDAAKFYGILGRVARRMGEDASVHGETRGDFSMTKAQAREKRDRIMNDPRYLDSNKRVRQPLIEQVETLNKIISGAA